MGAHGLAEVRRHRLGSTDIADRTVVVSIVLGQLDSCLRIHLAGKQRLPLEIRATLFVVGFRYNYARNGTLESMDLCVQPGDEGLGTREGLPELQG